MIFNGGVVTLKTTTTKNGILIRLRAAGGAGAD